jgi:NADH:ubiquinone oxidoreductase subunit K
MLLEISAIARTKKVILVILIKIELVFLVAYIGLSISTYDFKAHSGYSFKFLSIGISIVTISKLISIIISGIRKIELFKVTNNNSRNNKVIGIVI